MKTAIDEFAMANGTTDMKIEHRAVSRARKTTKRLGALALLGLLTLAAPLHAWATCTVKTAFNGTLIPGNVKIYTMAPFTLTLTASQVAGGVGTLLGPQQFLPLGSDNSYWICTGGTMVFRGATAISTVITDTIYSTGIPGIGYKLVTGAPPPWYPITVSRTSYTWAGGTGLAVQFVKTAATVGSGSFSGVPVTASSGAVIPNVIGGVWGDSGNTLTVAYQMSGSINIIVNNPACTVTTPNLVVPMGAALSKNFSGVGTLSNTQPAPVNINLQCSAGDTGTSTPISIGLTDTDSPGNTSTTLALDSSSTASGVGIRLFKSGGAPVSFGAADKSNTNIWSVTTVQAAGGNVVIPLTASYVQTGPTINGGTVKAYAAFTIYYD